MPGRLGFIVNPVAGLGGPVGLKGSDGLELQAQARGLGGAAISSARASLALAALAGEDVDVLTIGGAMGEHLCRAAGLAHRVMARFGPETQGSDTAAAAAKLVAAGAELILFSGGDGTARDIMMGAGRTPVLGIPGGVKMYSGVFATSAALAGRLAVRHLALPPALRRTTDADVLDIDEVAVGRGEPSLRLHGVAAVPASPAVQRAKASVPDDDDRQVQALCRELAGTLDPERVIIVGPGRTMRLFMDACGLPKTLLGVDLMHRGSLLAADCGERHLLAALDGRPGQIVVGLLGGQGCLFGRGNQPISSTVLRGVGTDRILVVAGAAKVATLPGGLFVDTGDPDLDRALQGFIRVHTGTGRSTLLRIHAAPALG